MAQSLLTTEFADQLAHDMKSRGFRKMGATWHRDQGQIIQVMNIQKSQWYDRFYINVGIYLKDLGSETRPSEYQCHVRCRSEQLVAPAELSELHLLLNFTEPVLSVERYARLRALIAKSALAWFDANSTKEALANTLRVADIKGFFIIKGLTESLTLTTQLTEF
jgi:hypothetical protein